MLSIININVPEELIHADQYLRRTRADRNLDDRLQSEYALREMPGFEGLSAV